MITNAFHYGCCAGVAYRKTFPGYAVEECFSAGRPVECDISNQNVFLGSKSRSARRINDKAPTRHALADIIVGFSLKCERDPIRQKCTQALTCRSAQANLNSVVRQSRGAVFAGDLSAEHCTHSTMDVAHRQINFNRDQRVDGCPTRVNDRVIERILQAVILRLHAAACDARRKWRAIKNC